MHDFKFQTLRMKHLPTSDRSRSSTKLTRLVPCCKSTYSAHWLILLARYNNNKNLINMISMKKTKSQPTSLVVHFVQHINIPYDHTRWRKKLIFTTNPYWMQQILNMQQWNQLATRRKKFTEPSPSHRKKITGMNHKKGEVNRYANLCKLFH